MYKRQELIAATNVAGDLVDYARMPDGKVACFLIDVPGRGLEATGLMAILSRMLIGVLSESDSPGAVLAEAAGMLRRRLDSVPLLISVGIMILDPEESSVKVAVAGHCPLFRIQGSDVTEYTDEDFLGPPLGAEEEEWREAEFRLNDNDVLLLFSDGLTKLSSPDRKILTRAEQLEIIAASAAGHRSVLETRLQKRLAEFRGDAVLADDLAFTMIHRSKAAATVDALRDFTAYPIDSETMDA